MAEFFKEKKPGIRSKDWNFGGSKWRLSRSKIDLFMECPRCFYIDNKLGVARPRGPAFTLNIAVDELLKKEFDLHRKQKTPHPLMDSYGIDAVPFDSKEMEVWRDNFKGIEFLHKDSGMFICGAVDDIWVNKQNELIVVDYKATSKDAAVKELSDTKWENQYKRQMDIYMWLLKNNGFKVSNTGYFVYVNGRKDRDAFDGKLEFDVTLIPYEGNSDWVHGKIMEIRKCLSSTMPPHSPDCEFCMYRKFVEEVSK